MREDRLDGFIREARLKMGRRRVGEVKKGGYGHGAGTVWVSSPAVGRRKPYKQRLDVRDLEVVSPAPRAHAGPQAASHVVSRVLGAALIFAGLPKRPTGPVS